MLDTVTAEMKLVPPMPSKAQGEERRRMTKWLSERIAASKKTPSAEVVTLTPVLAELLLERNPVNRPIGNRNLDAVKADIASKRFEFNGESIVVAKTGNLIDGQHRCQGVIATGLSIETVIVFGPKEEARYTIDIGKSKTAANFLQMLGWKDNNNLAACIAMLLQYRSTHDLKAGYVRPTKTEIINAAEQFRGLQDSIDIVAEATAKKLGSRSALAFCHYQIKRKGGKEAADDFMTKLIAGDELRKGSPIFYCREKLRSMDRGYRPENRVELVFKCWNALRRGGTLSSVRLSGSLPKLEA